MTHVQFLDEDSFTVRPYIMLHSIAERRSDPAMDEEKGQASAERNTILSHISDGYGSLPLISQAPNRGSISASSVSNTLVPSVRYSLAPEESHLSVIRKYRELRTAFRDGRRQVPLTNNPHPLRPSSPTSATMGHAP